MVATSVGSHRASGGRLEARGCMETCSAGVGTGAMAVTSHSSGILQEYNLKGDRSWGVFAGGMSSYILFSF